MRTTMQTIVRSGQWGMALGPRIRETVFWKLFGFLLPLNVVADAFRSRSRCTQPAIIRFNPKSTLDNPQSYCARSSTG